MKKQAMRTNSFPHERQAGVVLLITLIFLLMITLVATTTMNTSTIKVDPMVKTVFN